MSARFSPAIFFLAALLALATLSGCYSLRPSNGGARAADTHTRRADPADLAVPRGYRVEVVARDLNFPTGIAFGPDGDRYLVESGYAYGEIWTTPRLIRLDSQSRKSVVANGGQNGPWNGVQYHQGNLFVAEGGVLEGGRILKISEEGAITVLVSNLPSFGDHHANGPAVGPDGKIYFGLGTASNSGVVGQDNEKFGWLKRRPKFHDRPGEDVTLAGINYQTRQKGARDSVRKISTGAFVPYGQPTTPGQVIRGELICSGSILAVGADGGAVERLAWGFRNPFGLAFDREGKLWVTDNSYDDRGSRPLWGTSDTLWEVKRGQWYGWPDYHGNRPASSQHFKPPGKSRTHLLLKNPPSPPSAPAAELGVHAGAGGLDFSHSADFGHSGEAFVALFGDETPATGKLLHPVGFKVVRVDPKTGVVHDFAVNRGRRQGPASKYESAGLERPVAVRFDPSGRSLYVVDFGIMTHSPDEARPRQGTGVLWRIWKGEAAP